MDPDAALEELLQKARVNAEYGHRWAELVLGLDEWIRKGGFLPQRWQEGQTKVTLKVKVGR